MEILLSELSEEQKKLVRVMFFLSSFSISELQFVSGSGMEEQPQITQFVQSLFIQGYLDRADYRDISFMAALPAVRYQTTFDPRKYKELYNTVYEEPEQGDEVIGESFDDAQKLIANIETNVQLVEQGQKDLISQTLQDLERATDYLEVAFYEQTPKAREGKPGNTILQERDRLVALRNRLP